MVLISSYSIILRPRPDVFPLRIMWRARRMQGKLHKQLEIPGVNDFARVAAAAHTVGDYQFNAAVLRSSEVAEPQIVGQAHGEVLGEVEPRQKAGTFATTVATQAVRQAGEEICTKVGCQVEISIKGCALDEFCQKLRL